MKSWKREIRPFVKFIILIVLLVLINGLILLWVLSFPVGETLP